MFFRIVFIALQCLACLTVQAKPYVLFINPGAPSESFWRNVDLYVEETALQLEIELEIYHAHRNPLNALEFLQARMRVTPLPNYVILVNEKDSGKSLLSILKNYPVNVTFVLSDLLDVDKRRLQADPHWQRYLKPGVLPNNYAIGHLTAEDLFRQGDGQSGDIAMIVNESSTPAAAQQEQGVKAFINETPELTLAQRVYGNRNEETAYRQAKVLLSRHHNLRYLWTADEYMALGVLRAIEEIGRVAGKDIFISTIHTSEKMLSALAQGTISTLGGGHYVAAGLALIKVEQHSRTGQWYSVTDYHLFELISFESPLYSTLIEQQWRYADFNRLNLSKGASYYIEPARKER
ncbi:ABC transporter substrate-binding protein [Thaumasiovibrio sp. DFM-14]|uniref:ABC transporter substrate-binding protein n=1 Tax=Thaumasiovibrio sp. DFM-14 TaxID=3384792 RepID=UPI0039A3226A